MGLDDKQLEGAPKGYNKKVQRNSSFFRALKNSLHGIWMILVRERNLRIHIFLGFLILIAGLHYGLVRSDWLWVTVAVFTVISSEFLNTIIEALVDLVVEKRYHPLAGLAKDVAAGGVLAAVAFEIIILLIVFQPYVWRQFGIVTNFSQFIHNFSR
ncbi:diacylglycerol kinase family protein [Leuconostoc pseudomesenteroides]|uniref:diacylglycerol kinase family protein n=1 Tax=Leuconostoc pseudomesenteroides TaxID=33968 RepID=UPI001B8C38A5|nr:diacylglycerol kinase family protein [Leuconostoc pseudomesenteroides]MBS0956894.1 diacylglycerol kinase family protein [Leuconostoc pseudomesenteroides]